MAGSRDLRAPLAFLGIVIFLGVNFVAVRVSNRELTPFWGGAFRFLLASAILTAFALARGIAWPRGRALAGAALFGALAFGGNFALLYWALRTAPASLASVLFATVPLLTLLGALALGQERFLVRALVGALVAGVGAAAIFLDQLRGDVPLPAILAILGAALCAAASGLVVRAFPRGHPVTTNAVGMGVGAAILLALALGVSGEVLRLPRAAASWGAVGWLVASSTLAFVLMVWLIGQWGASRTSYSAVVSPVVTAIAALVLTHEAVTWGLVAGGALVLVGVWVGALRGTRPPASTPSSATTTR